MSLPTTENYKIVVTTDPEHTDFNCYGVQNVGTEVIEYYDNLLPRTYQAMKSMEEKHKEMDDLINSKEPPELTLVPLESTDDSTQH